MRLLLISVLVLLLSTHTYADSSNDYINSISKDPNIKYLASTTRNTDDAMYLKAWTMKIQRVGNLNYPEQAKKYNLEGQLIIYVSIAKDGSLINSIIVKSSGHSVLDEAAKNIVKVSSPFARIPDKVLDKKSHVAIIRAWDFSNSSSKSKRLILKTVEK